MTTTTETYRPCSTDELVQQIGRATILAVSGGRIERRDTGITLPVARGYRVDIDLGWDDVWRVRRVFRRGGKEWIKGEIEAYADEVGEAVWKASCYLHDM